MRETKNGNCVNREKFMNLRNFILISKETKKNDSQLLIQEIKNIMNIQLVQIFC